MSMVAVGQNQGQNQLQDRWPVSEEVLGLDGVVLDSDFGGLGRLFAVATSEEQVFVYDTSSWELLQTFEPGDRTGPVAFNPDSSQLAIGKMGQIRIVNTSDWSLAQVFDVSSNQSVRDIAWPPNGGFLLYGAGTVGKPGLSITLRSTDNWNQVWSTGQGVDFLGLDFSPDSSKYVYGVLDEGHEVKIHGSGGELITSIKIPDNSRPTDVAFSPDLRFLAVSARLSGRWGGNNRVLIYEGAGDRWVQVEDFPQPSRPGSVSWSRNGEVLGYSVGQTVEFRQVGGKWPVLGSFSTGTTDLGIRSVKFSPVEGLVTWGQQVGLSPRESKIVIRGTGAGAGGGVLPPGVEVPGVGTVPTLFLLPVGALGAFGVAEVFGE